MIDPGVLTAGEAMEEMAKVHQRNSKQTSHRLFCRWSKGTGLMVKPIKCLMFIVKWF
jgi:hypothetical protein